MLDRRQFLTFALAATGGTLMHPAWAQAPATAGAMSRITAFRFAFPGLNGADINLAGYAGRPMLVVNTASLCGYTPQYAGLQELWVQFQKQGLTIIGVPSNDFGGQEPGGSADIERTAHTQYRVTFPITAKTIVKGPDAHPFYKWAAKERPRDLPSWNFHKYLIGRDGYIADVFPTAVEPTDTHVKTAIGQALAAS